MDPHDPDGIAAARTMLVLHAMQPRVRSAPGTRELPLPISSTGRKWWCQPHPGVSRCLHSRASGEAIASVADLQTG
jgi:hypothetical protein